MGLDMFLTAKRFMWHDEVCRSNFSKFDDNGNPIRNPTTGKIMKGPNFSPPNLRDIIYGK